MSILNYCLRNTIGKSSIFSTVKRSYKICCGTSVFHNNHALLSCSQPVIQSASNRFFMKKMGLTPMYDVYEKKAAKDKILPSEYTLIYNNTGETYVRCLSGIVMVTILMMPTIFIFSYFYLLVKDGYIDLKTYLQILFLSNSVVELMVMISVLILLKIASFSFISKYVLRIYKHNTKSQYVGVYINPFLPWKNINCTFDKAVKLPDGKNFLVPWYKEYCKLSGYKSIVLRERFRRPIDYDRMIGKENTMNE